MNERIKELAGQAGFVVSVSANADRQIERFAELVRQDEREREWVGLTDEEIAKTVGSPIDEVYLADFRRVIEKLRSKNT